MLYPPTLDGTPLQASCCPTLGISASDSNLEHPPRFSLTFFPLEFTVIYPPLMSVITPAPALPTFPRHENLEFPPTAHGYPNLEVQRSENGSITLSL